MVGTVDWTLNRIVDTLQILQHNNTSKITFNICYVVSACPAHWGTK